MQLWNWWRSEGRIEKGAFELEDDVEDDYAVKIGGETKVAFTFICFCALDCDFYWDWLFHYRDWRSLFFAINEKKVL